MQRAPAFLHKNLKSSRNYQSVELLFEKDIKNFFKIVHFKYHFTKILIENEVLSIK